MFPLQNKLRLIGSVLGVATNQNSIICADNFYNISTFSLSTKTIDKALQVAKKAEPLHPFSKSIAIGNVSGKVATGFATTPKGIVLKTEPQIAPISLLTWQKLEISKIAFSQDDNYLATGGEDGRVLVYTGDNYHLLLSLPPFPDYISSIVFSDGGTLIFSACFGKSAMIFDILKNTKIVDFKTDFVVEDAFFYDEDTKLFCATKNGTFTYDIRKQEFISKNTLQNSWLTVCKKLPGEKFAIIGGKYNPLHIIKISDHSVVDVIPSEQIGATSLFLDKNTLYAGYCSGYIEIIQIDKDKDEMLEFIAQNDLKSCLKLIQEKNLFLQILPQYIQKLDSLWKENLLQAIDLLAKDKLQEARNLVESFMHDPKKKEEFNYYWLQKESVAHFMDLIEAKNYAEAYNLIKQYPYLKDTIAYAQLEELWEKSFELAKRLLAQDAQHNLNQAQELLKPFSNVKGKKDSITMLLRNVDKFLQADKEFKAKNFIEYFKLCEKFPFLQETRIYKNALLIGNQLSQNIASLENKGDYNKALEICKLLSAMFPFKNIATEKSKTIQLKQEFIQYCTTQKLSKAFEMAESHFELHSLPEYKKLYEDFKIQDRSAFAFASKGDGKGTLDTLKNYLYIDCWKDKVASILKIAYLTEFIQNANQDSKNINWKETFQYYIERYSKDEEIKKVAAEMGISDILNSIPFDGNPKGYLNAIIADSLLCIDNQPLHEYQTTKG
ncbi:hypothetical protein BA184_04440 [Helicobacter pullorum]|uniref:WD40 repeat domain-containing protein n=1 Tax=Helicobacter pullorum TaxID=35818 RepID=UPI0008169EBB|nr:hypothetical protein [Helicobacter pullorum]OCR03348.1 hypothetical protein BA729_07300 [Helicobacter pullorum]OCR07313.1 hypothetical protein BA185_04735 [Helicobacter pullorum]OCR10421.1 hypothetical protein BA184_04440 [Helicobacter pullorum]OCR13169.1 hypothetical protein BA730_01675 [Helicobacter pullorum]